MNHEYQGEGLFCFQCGQPNSKHGSVEARIETKQKEKRDVIERVEFEEKTRVQKARDIAIRLAIQNGQTTVHEVHDEFDRIYGPEEWYDDRGNSYWAGAIFRGKQFECIGTTRSPYNHNDSNRVWRYRGE